MVNIPEAVRSGIEKYVERIRQEISVDKAILFGSYASGNFDNGSDIDSAIFSNYFQGMRRVDSIAFLLGHAMDYDLDIEPLAFTPDEYSERLGIVDEILKTGIEL
jgi:predicted nucleotidyltransferase